VKNKSKVVKKEELDSLRNQLARALADYDNLRKRVEKERETLVMIASLNLIENLLPTFDMLKDAEEHSKDHGLDLIVKEFSGALEKAGIVKINVESGDKFDEDIHEVVEVASVGGKKDGDIIEEVLTGWKFENGLIIRPAKVKVFSKKE